tara:strand:+ start:8860 stop:9255 length:396 start_codon:yes stop_codon:yes gene_type:complete
MFKEIEPLRGSIKSGCGISIIKAKDLHKMRIVLRKDVIEKTLFKVGGDVDCFAGLGEDAGWILIKPGSKYRVSKSPQAVTAQILIPIIADVPNEIRQLTDAAHQFKEAHLYIKIPEFSRKAPKGAAFTAKK